MKNKLITIWIFILFSIAICQTLFLIEFKKENNALRKLIMWQDRDIDEMHYKIDTYTDLILREYVKRESE